jgi:RNA-binding protein
MALTGKQRRTLRALAHHRKPVVQVGSGGIADAVIAKVNAELEVHELIKVKVAKEAPVPVAEAAAALGPATRSELVQIIGRTVILYRGRKKKPGIVLPKAEAGEEVAPPAAPSADDDGADGTDGADEADEADDEG